MGHRRNDASFDPGTRAILKELRDLRVEMRAERRQAEADRRQAEAGRRRADAERRRSGERFEKLLREFREDSARREAATQKALEAMQQMVKDIQTIGLSIVKTLNHHTRILERIDRKLEVPRQNGPRP